MWEYVCTDLTSSPYFVPFLRLKIRCPRTDLLFLRLRARRSSRNAATAAEGPVRSDRDETREL